MTKDNMLLIKKIRNENFDGVEYEDFVSREDFINRTGIFVTPDYFDRVYDNFCEAGVSADEFIENYESKYATGIEEAEIHGKFKYEVDDCDITAIGSYDDGLYEPTIWDLMNNLAKRYENECIRGAEVYEMLEEVSERNVSILKKCEQTNQSCEKVLLDLISFAASTLKQINNSTSDQI